MYSDQVFVFSPNGDLPHFKRCYAYRFCIRCTYRYWSNCIGVKINNSIKPLYTKLKNGDQVEIITGKENIISPKWFDLDHLRLKHV